TRSKRDWSSDVCSSDLVLSIAEPQSGCDQVVVEILKRKSLFVVAVISPFAGQGYAPVEGNHNAGARLMVIQRATARGAHYCVSQVQSDIANDPQIQIDTAEMAILNVKRAVICQKLGNDEEYVGIEVGT